jgi:hypothetical protein
MSTLKLTLNAKGFESLWDNSMKWAGNNWQVQETRFEPKPTYKWRYAYFFESYTALVMAQAYLKSTGYKSAVHEDLAGGWVLLSNYMSPCWSK